MIKNLKSLSHTPTSDEFSAFQSFTKGSKAIRAKGANCVIYTRVSTKEQADNNMSLETQKKACEAFAAKQGYQVMGCFGGTFESAKTDERKQFNTMLSFVKKSKEKIGAIIVYSVDRFSRSGANAIYLAEQLKGQGIVVCAVTQPTDASTASGSLQQNIQFIFSEYDNQLRREKCMAGVKEKLLAGMWCTVPPLGYDIVRRDGKKEIVLNWKGKLVRKAFQWKAQGMSNEAVLEKLAAQGWKVNNQRIGVMLRNPFYCGLIVHSALEGQVVEGKHEKAIGRDVFLLVNGLLAKNSQGYTCNPENEEIPLKRFLKCADCGSYLTAYKASKNQKYYYKCRTKGCCSNKRADVLHEAFRNMLLPYSAGMQEDMAKLAAMQMTALYHNLNHEKQETREELNKRQTEVRKKIARLEDRFMEEEIDREMFDRYREKYMAEKLGIEKGMAEAGDGSSNLADCIDSAIELAAKLPSMWELGDYSEKQQLQFLVFPEGIAYDRKNDECRTQ